MSQQDTTVRNLVMGIISGVAIIVAVASVIILLLNEQLQFNAPQEESAEARFERIKPISQVNIKGVRKPLPENLVFNSGKEVYDAVCTTCHATGVVGAPKFADKNSWAERLAKGEKALITSAINGLNVMPPRGGNSDLSNEAIKMAVRYMLVAATDGKAPVSTEPSTPIANKSGKEVYEAVCTTCHKDGLLGAPKYGNKSSWAQRLPKGEETLISNAINGLNNVMPPRGGNADLSDEEVKQAVQYMLAAMSDEEAPKADESETPKASETPVVTPEPAEPSTPVIVGKSGKEVYEGVCAICHKDGLLGAPKYGNKLSWAQKLSKGEETLVNNALNGFNNAMPPRGGNSSLSNDEVKRAVQYMLKAVSDKEASVAPLEPAETVPAEKKKSSETPNSVSNIVGKSGKAVYDTVCGNCHTASIIGAPKFGDKASWAERLAKGEATLITNAFDGFNLMPPRGGNSGLTDEEVKRAVQYMLAAVSDEEASVTTSEPIEVAPTESKEPEKVEAVPTVVPKEDTSNLLTPIDEPKKIDIKAVPVNVPEKVTPADAPEKVEAAPTEISEKTETVPVDKPEVEAAPADQSEKADAAPIEASEKTEIIVPVDKSEKAETTPSVDVPKEAIISPPKISTNPKVEEKRFFHIVKNGDTLFRIGRSYGVSSNDLKTWNNLQIPYSLSIGQKLWVSPPTTIVPPQLF